MPNVYHAAILQRFLAGTVRTGRRYYLDNGASGAADRPHSPEAGMMIDVPHVKPTTLVLDLQTNLAWLEMQANDAYDRGDYALGAMHSIAYHETARTLANVTGVDPRYVAA